MSGVPLAERLRPVEMGAFLGQAHLAARIDALLAAKRLPSLLLFGPPGCGKSSLALLLARGSGLRWLRLSAPEAGLASLRRALTGVDVLVLDELHRFSRAQQDFFLPLVESGEHTRVEFAQGPRVHSQNRRTKQLKGGGYRMKGVGEQAQASCAQIHL